MLELGVSPAASGTDDSASSCLLGTNELQNCNIGSLAHCCCAVTAEETPLVFRRGLQLK